MTYTLRTALSGLWRERWVNLLCMLTIAIGIFTIAAAYIVVHNVSLATRRMPDRFSVMVFLTDEMKPGDIKSIIAEIQKNPDVKSVRYISKEEALRDLADAMNDSEFVLEGLDANPLPASLELKLNGDSVSDAAVGALVKDLGAMQGVSDVHYASRVLSVIQKVKRYTDRAGALAIAFVTVSVLFVCYSTVKILLYRKQDEINTLKLLGATKWFIRSPFLIEGGVLGLLGGMLGLGAMASLYVMVFYRVSEQFPLLRAIEIPLELGAAMPMAGFVVGVAGAMLAVGKIRF